jgi:glycosyltransferase involved in cell wall biosynthesis
MDLFVLPTKRRSESLSLVGLEAFASGVLTVINTMYGPKEYANKKNSLIYESEESKVLSEIIDDALKLSDEDKNKIIKNAHETALKYDKSKMSSILEGIFK